MSDDLAESIRRVIDAAPPVDVDAVIARGHRRAFARRAVAAALSVAAVAFVFAAQSDGTPSSVRIIDQPPSGHTHPSVATTTPHSRQSPGHQGATEVATVQRSPWTGEPTGTRIDYLVGGVVVYTMWADACSEPNQAGSMAFSVRRSAAGGVTIDGYVPVGATGVHVTLSNGTSVDIDAISVPAGENPIVLANLAAWPRHFSAIGGVVIAGRPVAACAWLRASSPTTTIAPASNPY